MNKEQSNKGFQFFGAVGRFSVRFRWLVVVVWVFGTFIAVHNLPSLSNVTQSNNTSFLPASAPSQKAINLASRLGKEASAPTVAVIVATTNGLQLSSADEQYVTGLQTDLAKVSGVQGIRSGGIAADGQAQEFDVVVSNGVSTEPTRIINSIHSAIDKTGVPSNLEVHMAGQLADEVDSSKKAGSQNSQIQLGAIIFIIVLLLLIFRAPLARSSHLCRRCSL